MKRGILFVDDDQNVLQGIARLFTTWHGDWHILLAGSAEQALEMMEQSPVDVVVSDMYMSGMGGLEMFRRIREKYPGVMRFFLSGRIEEEKILDGLHCAHQFLSKPVDLVQLKDAIIKALIWKEMLDHEELQKYIAGLVNLPSLPAIYQQLLAELNSPNAALDRIGSLVASDVAMTARVLQCVNSLVYGLPQKISNVRQAVVMLGLETLRALFLYTHLIDILKPRSGARQKEYEMFWQHSNAVALRARELVLSLGGSRLLAERSFVVGLLHDIGKLVLLKYNEFFPKTEDYSLVGGEIAREKEREIWGVTHEPAGAYLLSLWGIAPEICEAVAGHHECGQPEQDTGEVSLVRVIWQVHREFRPAGEMLLQ